MYLKYSAYWNGINIHNKWTGIFSLLCNQSLVINGIKLNIVLIYHILTFVVFIHTKYVFFFI